MPEPTSYDPGTFCWADLVVPDLDAARTFYGGLYGWEFQTEATPGGEYVMAFKNGKVVAGIGQPVSDDESIAWNTYVRVDDVDATAATAADLGGAVVVDPTDAMEAGRLAFIAAPGGETFGLWQPKNHSGAGLVGEHGSVVWNELMTRDLPKTVDFYSGLLGWTVRTGPVPGTDMEYSVANAGDTMAAGIATMDDNSPPDMAPHWLIYFEVDDCEASAAAVKDLGGTVLVPPMSVPDVGTFATIQDPGGAVSAIMTSAPMPSS
ncbi:MAG: VOC family protein [Acidimicrobiia bacterium]|nr:VOC family protein [Acidimicrobiia bacterium]